MKGLTFVSSEHNSYDISLVDGKIVGLLAGDSQDYLMRNRPFAQVTHQSEWFDNSFVMFQIEYVFPSTFPSLFKKISQLFLI